MIAGQVWQRIDSLVWSPSQGWRGSGAREFLLRLGNINEIELAGSSGRAKGIVVRADQDAEVWLWLKGPMVTISSRAWAHQQMGRRSDRTWLNGRVFLDLSP